MPKLPTSVFSIGIQNMQRSFNNLDGCITSRVLAFKVKSRLLSIWNNLSVPVRLVKYDRSHILHANTWQIKAMHRAGTSLVGATCHNRSTPRHTRPISKLFIETDGIRLSGARLAFCTTKLTSTEMRLMHIPARYA